MLVDMVAVRMMQVSVVQIVDVLAMANGGVTALRAMLVFMIGMMWLRALRHRASPAASFAQITRENTVNAWGWPAETTSPA